MRALDAVSLSLKQGEILGLIGPNGSGKSTLVKCIMGFYHATSGQMMVAGREEVMTDPKTAYTRTLVEASRATTLARP